MLEHFTGHQSASNSLPWNIFHLISNHGFFPLLRIKTMDVLHLFKKEGKPALKRRTQIKTHFSFFLTLVTGFVYTTFEKRRAKYHIQNHPNSFLIYKKKKNGCAFCSEPVALTKQKRKKKFKKTIKTFSYRL